MGSNMIGLALGKLAVMSAVHPPSATPICREAVRWGKEVPVGRYQFGHLQLYIDASGAAGSVAEEAPHPQADADGPIGPGEIP